MADASDARRIAATLAGVSDDSTESSLTFALAGKGIAWSWKERVHPKKPRRPRLDVLAVRCVGEFKETILESDPEVYFTEPHYNGFPAVLVRLDKVSVEELREILESAKIAVETTGKPKRSWAKKK
jgi:hypothetical protein